MFKAVSTFAVIATISFSGWTSSAHAIGLLLPAIQKVRDAGSRTSDEGWLALDEKEDVKGDPQPVLMVISNQDFYYVEYFETRFVGSGKDAKVVLTGLAEVGTSDSGEKQSCFCVVTLSPDPENPDQLQVEIETEDAATRRTTIKTFVCPSDNSFTITLEYLILM